MLSDIEKIKEKLSIEDLVSSFVKLERFGTSLKARCPFHNEKTPSFTVSPERQMYYCFGCGRGGDIFTFTQEIEGLDFKDVLQKLADKTGIELSNTKVDNTKVSLKKRGLQALELATKKYEVNLRRDTEVVDYLLNRGLTKETLISFKVGYAPLAWSEMSEYLLKKGFSGHEIEECGIATKGKHGLVDRFRERIMFPIFNEMGEVVGFSGRIFTKKNSDTDISKVGKYINSPDSIFYDKKRVLYGYDKAKQAIRKKDRVILVEGQMDLLMAHQSGFTEAVAISGTAFSNEHAKKISRFTDVLITCFDGDEAGIKASGKIAMQGYKLDLYVAAAALPSGKDPADVLLEDKDKFVEIIENAEDFILFRLRLLDLSSLDDRMKLKTVQKEIYPLLLNVSQPILYDQLVRKIADLLGVSNDSILQDIEKVGSKLGISTSVKDWEDDVSINKKGLSTIEILQGIIFWQGSLIKPNINVSQVESVMNEFKLCNIDNVEDRRRGELAFIAENEFMERVDELASITADLLNRKIIEKLKEEKNVLRSKMRNTSDDHAIELLKKIHDIDKRIDNILVTSEKFYASKEKNNK